VLIKRIDEVAAVKVDVAGAEKTTVRVVFGPKDAAPTFALRQFELAPGGCTPFHTHPWEHQIVVLQGQIELRTDTGSTALDVGQAVMIMPDEKHQFRNCSQSETGKMLCLIPVQFQK